MNKRRLSDRELEVMQVLWASETPVIASEIQKLNSELNINTIQAVLRKLLQKKMIEVADIVYSGTVLSRSYKPIVSADEYLLLEFENIFPNASAPKHAIMAALSSGSYTDSELERLEQMILDFKRGETE